MKRAQYNAIRSDLEKKLVLLVGPRQAGKTWLAREIAGAFSRSLYLNYDNSQDRAVMDAQSWHSDLEILVLDELHKMPNWKNYLKGVFDTKPASMRMLVTGSARLDVLEQMGDSLAGRYFRHRLLPVSWKEIGEVSETENLSFNHFLERGGFPEPLLAESSVDAARWRLQYTHALLSTDVFEFDRVQNLKAMRMIVEMLRRRVGSQVSYESIAEDVSVSLTTVKKYIEILEALYIIFRVKPFSKNIARALKKAPKFYFFDTGLVIGDEGAVFENVVATALLKHVYALEDYDAKRLDLNYVRTKEGREVDFVLSENDELKQYIEVKVSERGINPALRYFVERYPAPAVQVVRYLRTPYQQDGVSVQDAVQFLSSLRG